MSFKKKIEEMCAEDVANPASSVGGRVGNTETLTHRQKKKARERERGERESCLDCSFFLAFPSAKSRHSAQELAHLSFRIVYASVVVLEERSPSLATVPRRLRRRGVAPALIDDAIIYYTSTTPAIFRRAASRSMCRLVLFH
jgi:hypothetical protein